MGQESSLSRYRPFVHYIYNQLRCLWLSVPSTPRGRVARIRLISKMSPTIILFGICSSAIQCLEQSISNHSATSRYLAAARSTPEEAWNLQNLFRWFFVGEVTPNYSWMLKLIRYVALVLQVPLDYTTESCC